MKFRVGQSVKIKSWNRMADEFGLTPYGDIATSNPFFGGNEIYSLEMRYKKCL